MAKNKERKVGIYVRLSKEDGRAEESVSIENQKLMLEKYVQEKKWKLYDTYQDDGFSGTHQNRPAFQRMIADVKASHINTILIKDLSRLGRNYLEVGNLAEVFLPAHDCELISLNEKLDDMMVFRNWFNEQHSKTTSQKVRAGKRTSAQNGKFVGAYAPYGYQKAPDNPHKLLPDATAAPIVRRIFQQRARGIGFRAIAESLNNDGTLPPREYYYQINGKKNTTRTSKLWSENTIKDMIKNEVYIGNLVYGKSGTVSYKNQKQVRKEEEEWIRCEGTHEPIIDHPLWERVHALRHKKYYPSKRADGESNPFVGLLYCADCGFKLRANVERRIRKNGSVYKNVTYICSTYGRSGKSACTIHSISEKALVELVASHIKSYARLTPIDTNHIVEQIVNASSNHADSQNELQSHQSQLEKLDLLIESLYEDKVAGIIPISLFKRQAEKYEKERMERQKAIHTLESRLQRETSLGSNASHWSEIATKAARCEEVDSEILLSLIDKIVIHEAKIEDGKRVCDVDVTYAFAGDIDKLNLLREVC